jgi:hypothetical protein
MINNFVAFLQEIPASDGTNRGRSGQWFPQSPVPGSSYKAGATFIVGTRADTAGSLNNTAVLTVTGPTDTGGTFSGVSYSSKAGTTPQSPESVDPSGTYTVTDTSNQRVTGTLASGKLAGNASVAFYADFAGELIAISTDNTNQEPQIIFLDQ